MFLCAFLRVKSLWYVQKKHEKPKNFSFLFRFCCSTRPVFTTFKTQKVVVKMSCPWVKLSHFLPHAEKFLKDTCQLLPNGQKWEGNFENFQLAFVWGLRWLNAISHTFQAKEVTNIRLECPTHNSAQNCP